MFYSSKITLRGLFTTTKAYKMYESLHIIGFLDFYIVQKAKVLYRYGY